MESQRTPFMLKYPFEWEGRIIDSLDLRRLKVKDVQKLPKDETELALQLLCRSSGETPTLLKEMDVEDFHRAGEVVGDFFGKSRETGGTSSDGLPIE